MTGNVEPFNELGIRNCGRIMAQRERHGGEEASTGTLQNLQIGKEDGRPLR